MNQQHSDGSDGREINAILAQASLTQVLVSLGDVIH
jgi:hypothetical protein